MNRTAALYTVNANGTSSIPLSLPRAKRIQKALAEGRIGRHKVGSPMAATITKVA